LSRVGGNHARAVLSVDADAGRKILFVRIAKRRLVYALLFLLGAGFLTPLSAESLGELFARVKARVAAGAYADGLLALSELEAEAQKPENEKARAPMRPAAAFYRGVCLAALGQPDEAKAEFAIFIAANPDRGIDRKMYPASVVAAFEQARKSRPGAAKAEDSLSALMLAYRSTSSPSEFASAPGPDWANGPVKYLLAEEEKLAFSRLSDDSSRARFVALFWRARDPSPETPDNEFRREFERRVAFADVRPASPTSTWTFPSSSQHAAITARNFSSATALRSAPSTPRGPSPMRSTRGSRLSPASYFTVAVKTSSIR
jgi:hypothetical protein